MKKFFAVAALILGVVVGQIVVPSQAEAYDPYENDANFAYVYSGHGGTMYLDLNSVNVQAYDPPHYQIAGTFVFQPATSNNASTNESYVEMRFNYSTKEHFERSNGGQWQSKDVRGDSAISSRNRAMANALFRAAYRMNFYN
ncbi:MAG: hypothetical protein IJ685_11185 [Selenomonadaceae bacterium]|nr:hypothetical protein [Selenomonadaceae bacterium]